MEGKEKRGGGERGKGEREGKRGGELRPLRL